MERAGNLVIRMRPLLKSDQVNFALTLFDDSDSETVSIVLIDEPCHLQASSTHPLHDRGCVHVSQLEGETLVTRNITDYGYSARVSLEWRESGP